MADPDHNLDPEPVDAEFEPALDDAELAALRASSGPGWAGVLVIAVIAILGGGTLGAIGSGFVQPTVSTDPAIADTRLAMAETVTNLETRLAALEGEDPAEAVRRALADDIAAAQSRIERLEAVPPGTTDLTGVQARLSALETAPAATEPAIDDARLTEIEAALSRNDALINQALDQAQTSDPAAIDPQILEALSQRLAALEAADGTDAAVSDSSAQIAALTERLTAVEAALIDARAVADTARTTAETAVSNVGDSSQDGTDARQLAARALALTALRDMAASGGAFEAERAALARLWRGHEDLAALATYSRAGSPTLDDLQDSYPGAAIREAAGPGRVFFGLIEMRQVEAGAGETGPLAITALAEGRLTEGDLVGALTLTERLEDEALDAARDWLLGARARLQTDAHINAMRNALAESAAAQGADPS